MKILVTGAQDFCRRLTWPARRRAPPKVSKLVAVDTVAFPIDDPRVDCKTGTITDDRFTSSIVEADVDAVYHLAAVVSGQAEAEFDLGMRVNVDATRALLEACRRLETPPRFIFASSLAVYGGVLPAIVPDDAAVVPIVTRLRKSDAELWCRRIRAAIRHGIACRLPTVARPPVRQAPRLASEHHREPLAGIDTVSPVQLDTSLWIASPEFDRHLVNAARVRRRSEDRRAVNLPGLSVTPEEMLDSLERLAGAAARARVRCELDRRIMHIGWTGPGAFDASRALRLGFRADRDVDSVVRQFMAERLR